MGHAYGLCSCHLHSDEKENQYLSECGRPLKLKKFESLDKMGYLPVVLGGRVPFVFHTLQEEKESFRLYLKEVNQVGLYYKHHIYHF